MRQKFSVRIADITMNIVCEETQEIVNAASAKLDRQIRALTGAHQCTKAEAAILAGLDLSAQTIHLGERIAELEEILQKADPNGDNFEASLLRGENETLRGELQLARGAHDALLQDNATLFSLNAKLVRQNNEANARADRMHDQVISILAEVRELREQLAAMCVDTRAPSPSYTAFEPQPRIEITPKEQQVTQKYEQMDIDDILNTAPQPAAREGAHPLEGLAAVGAPVDELDDED